MRIRGFTQDDAHIFCTPDQLVDEVCRCPGVRAVGAAGVRVRGLRGQPLDPARGEVGRHRRGLGARHRGAAHRPRAGGPALRDRRGRRGLLRAQDRRQGPRRHRPQVAAVHHPGRLQHARALRHQLRRPGQRAAPGGHDPPGPVRLGRAVLRGPPRALRRRVPGLAGAGAGAGAPRRATTTTPTPAAWSTASRRRATGPTWSTPPSRSGTRIRRAKLEKLPYVLVVGDDDVEHCTVGVNPRGGEVERDVPVDDFVERLAADVVAHL